MADLTGPNLMVVGGDSKRLQWLTHHVTSHWPNAQVTTLPAGEPAAVNRLIAERTLDAVILQADFADEPAARIALHDLGQMLQIQPGLYCILLADNGDEMTAVRALKSGAKDYLPLARITRDQLLAAIMEACAKRRAATQAVKVVGPAQAEAPGIEVPGYSILKEIATSNFSQVYLARSERFQREYEIISSISHRAIAEIYDFGSLPHHLYLAMEYFPCGDLRDRLRN